MAENCALVEDYLNCHVCSEIFRDPVTLSCSHNFCSSCLKKFWEQAGNKNCPICKRKSSKDNTAINLELKALADSVSGRKKPRYSETEENVKTPTMWTKHKEEHRSFCEDDDMLPISDLKQQLEPDLKSLEDKRNTCKKVEKSYKHMIQHLEKQLQSTENKIRAEFKKLHQFLEEEEKSRLEILREEENQKGKTISTEMKKIQDQISSLSEMIEVVEADLQKDNTSFLSSYKSTWNRSRTQCSQPDPHLLSGVLIDEAKHLGNLSFIVWEKLKNEVHFSPVTLDPNTANQQLYLSDDLTSVTCGNTSQELPENPERNTNYSNVFGSEAFDSGKHSWDVEVGDHPDWHFGLVKESVDRMGERSATPKNGIWCISYKAGNYTDCLGEALTVKKSLQKIRVQLDYQGGKVSFYNSEDMSHIYTHRETFTEKLFPYFSVYPGDDTKTSEIKICPTEVCLDLSEK